MRRCRVHVGTYRIWSGPWRFVPFMVGPVGDWSRVSHRRWVELLRVNDDLAFDLQPRTWRRHPLNPRTWRGVSVSSFRCAAYVYVFVPVDGGSDQAAAVAGLSGTAAAAVTPPSSTPSDADPSKDHRGGAS
jgi:hypothetical protein